LPTISLSMTTSPRHRSECCASAIDSRFHASRRVKV
jgi:hypothetical protein